MSNSTDEKINVVYTHAKAWVVDNESPSFTNIIALATNLMTIVQRVYGKGKGEEKKAVVLNVLCRIIKEDVDEEKKETMLNVANTLVPPAIDAIVALAASNSLKKVCRRLNCLKLPCM